jgi:TPR repeat protein
MSVNPRIVEKEIGQLLKMPVAPHDDWYEVMGGAGLKDLDRKRFNTAVEFFVNGSYESAFKRFGRLSAKGSAISQYHLGLMYLKGLGVLQDFCRAHLWLNMASSRGNKKARVQLEKLTKRMSAQQVADAQKLARVWAAQNRRNR